MSRGLGDVYKRQDYGAIREIRNSYKSEGKYIKKLKDVA